MMKEKMASMKGVVAKYNTQLEMSYGGARADGAKGMPLSGKIRFIMAPHTELDQQQGPVGVTPRASISNH